MMIMSDLNTVTAPALPALQGSLDRSPTGDTPNCDSALTICPIKGDMDLAGGCSLSELPRDQCLPRRIAGGGRWHGLGPSPPCCEPWARVLLSLTSVSPKAPKQGERWPPGYLLFQKCSVQSSSSVLVHAGHLMHPLFSLEILVFSLTLGVFCVGLGVIQVTSGSCF